MKSSITLAALLVVIFLGSGRKTVAAKEVINDDSAAEAIEDFCSLVDVVCESELSIEDKIRIAAKESGVDEETAVRVARCESTLNPKAQNKHSSASGIYQFTIGTWRWIGAEKAGLNRFNADDSIKMFMAWYPQHKNWWSCK